MNQPSYRALLPEGFKLHWYTIKSVLGQGGSGVTYLAHDNNLDNLVAIKEYFPVDFSSRDEGFSVRATESPNRDMYSWGLDRFIKEARILAKFKHHNIVRVLSVFEQNNTAYMVMEYEQGKPLSQVYKNNKRLSQGELLKLFLPILTGLNLVHQAGFIHRDIKPSNIYIRSDGSPVLIDFGAARRVVDSAATQQLTSIVTYGYAPFEQYNEGDEKQGPWSDIYALGACLYVAVTGSPPVEAMSRGATMLSKGIDSYRAASVLASDHYSADFLRAIDCALMFYAEDRPQNTSEWAGMLTGKTQAPSLPEDMLQPMCGDGKETIVMPFPPSGRRSGILSSHPTPHTAPVKEPKKRTAATFIIPIALVLIVAFGATAYVILQRPEPHDQIPVQVTPEPKPPILVDQAKPEQEPDQQQINDLFTQAHSAMVMGWQIAPVKKSAIYFYQRIREIDQQNKRASISIEEIIDTHIKKVETHLAKDEFKDADLIIQQLNAVAYDSEKVREVAVTLENERAKTQRLTDLIAQAENAYEKKRLTKPKDNNALSYYRQVLAIDSDNAAAKQGITQIAVNIENQAKSNIKQGKLVLAEQNLDTLKTIAPTTSALDQLDREIEEKKQSINKINKLLRQAKSAMDAGRLTVPASKNAAYYFKKVLKLSPEDSQAKQGIQNIKQRLKKKFEQNLQSNKYEAAESVVRSVEKTFPGSRLAKDLRVKLIRNIPPPRPDFELISETLSRFKSAFETRSITKLKKVSSLSSNKQNFLEKFFVQYRSFKVQIANFQHIERERKGSVEILLTNLINQQGQVVQGGSWSHFSIEVKRNASGKWKVFW